MPWPMPGWRCGSMPEERGMADFTLERLAAIVAERARAPVAESLYRAAGTRPLSRGEEIR